MVLRSVCKHCFHGSVTHMTFFRLSRPAAPLLDIHLPLLSWQRPTPGWASAASACRQWDVLP